MSIISRAELLRALCSVAPEDQGRAASLLGFFEARLPPPQKTAKIPASQLAGPAEVSGSDLRIEQIPLRAVPYWQPVSFRVRQNIVRTRTAPSP